jgi:hypothetical protein
MPGQIGKLRPRTCFQEAENLQSTPRYQHQTWPVDCEATARRSDSLDCISCPRLPNCHSIVSYTHSCLNLLTTLHCCWGGTVACALLHLSAILMSLVNALPFNRNSSHHAPRLKFHHLKTNFLTSGMHWEATTTLSSIECEQRPLLFY